MVGRSLFRGSILSCAAAKDKQKNDVNTTSCFKRPPGFLYLSVTVLECNQCIRHRIVPSRIMEDAISRRDLLVSTVSLLLADRLLPAQQDSPKDTTFSTDVNVVNVFATGRDKKGQIVRNLAKDDFTLAEDGRPQTIRYFSQESGLPLTLGLLVDTSMSQRRVLGKERDASYRFLDQVLREDQDQAFLIHFDREVELLQDLTSSRKKLAEALG